ncbi:MAG: S-layer homology domain-containing protein [Syntrophomonadaceae bacterium]|jgi:hypothetical protein
MQRRLSVLLLLSVFFLSCFAGIVQADTNLIGPNLPNSLDKDPFLKDPIPLKDPYLEVTPSSQTVQVGETATYQALLHLTTGAAEDVTNQCKWSIADPLATEDDKGIYTGTTPGSTEITAFYSKPSTVLTHYVPPLELEAQAQLTVVEKQISVRYSLEVKPETASIMVGETQQYRAILHASEQPDKDVTEDSYWSLSPNIADMIDSGLYRGTIKGTAKVIATYGKATPAELTDSAVLIVDSFGPPPPTENLPEGKMIDRQPGYITLSKPLNLSTPAEQFTMDYNASAMDSNPDRYPKVFYWNSTYEKWVALASYPVAPGKVSAINDGLYSGWFVVMGCIQPRFTDTSGHWAERTANRMNGLGLLEGYPDAANPSSLIRPAGLERVITRAELTAAIARILGLAPGDTHLYPSLSYLSEAENNLILSTHYADAAEIPQWACSYIAAMTKAGLVNGKGAGFAANDPLTRIEAAVMISNALKNVPGFGTPADLTTYTDYSDIPAWAMGRVAKGTIGGYPDGSLRPNQPIKRSESITLLLTLLRGLSW